MDWTEAISKAVQYIEDNIIEDISAEDVANHVNISAYYFQKGFSLLCGYTITEYIRNRRLAKTLDKNDVQLLAHLLI